MDLQSGYLRTFVQVDLMGTRHLGWTPLGDPGLRGRYRLLPNFVSFATYLSSPRWPVLNAALESWFERGLSPAQSPWSRRWGGLTVAERANLTLQEHGLRELLDSPEEAGEEGLEAVVGAKARQLLLGFAAIAGPGRFDREMTAFLQRHRGRPVSEGNLLAMLEGLGVADAEARLETWFGGTELPGYEVEEADTWLVRQGERTRTQVEVTITNPTAVDGVVEVGLRLRGPTGIPGPTAAPAPTTGAWWRSRRPRAGASASWSTHRRRRSWSTPTSPGTCRPSSGCPCRRPGCDAGPSPSTARARGRPRKGRRASTSSTTRIPASRSWGWRSPTGCAGGSPTSSVWRPTPSRTSAFAPGVRRALGRRATDPAFYGRFVLSGHYKRPGDGRSRVSWSTEIGEAGHYDLFYYVGSFEEFRWGKQELSFLVHHEDGVESASLDMVGADEGWNLLGTYPLAAGPAHVELTDRGPRRTVVADAVKWVRR